MNANREYLSQTMTDAGIKPSYQRLRIIEYLYGTENHPTADIIYKDLKPEIPTLSKTTVYNTLNLFVKQGVASALSIEGNEIRYDYNTDTHGHFRCNECRELFDFELSEGDIQIATLSRFEVEQVHLYVKGVCSNCK